MAKIDRSFTSDKPLLVDFLLDKHARNEFDKKPKANSMPAANCKNF